MPPGLLIQFFIGFNSELPLSKNQHRLIFPERGSLCLYFDNPNDTKMPTMRTLSLVLCTAITTLYTERRESRLRLWRVCSRSEPDSKWKPSRGSVLTSALNGSFWSRAPGSKDGVRFSRHGLCSGSKRQGRNRPSHPSECHHPFRKRDERASIGG
jgi:hypothetical protein